MRYAAEKEQFDREGFVIVRQLLPPAEFAELETNVDRYIRDVVPTVPETHAFYQDRARPDTLKQLQYMDVDPYFAAYRRHPRWNELAQALLGERVEIRPAEWFGKPPRTEHPTPPHQDNYYPVSIRRVCSPFGWR
jgi:phytanoyl-CoA hydroxylase